MFLLFAETAAGIYPGSAFQPICTCGQLPLRADTRYTAPMTSPNYSVALIAEQLAERGYARSRAEMDGQRYEILKKDGSIWVTRDKAADYPFVSNTHRAVSKSKLLAYDYVGGLGYDVPATRTLQIPNHHDLDLVMALAPRLVVKPENSAGSRGLTLDITQSDQLPAAIDKAARYASTVLVQEMFEGEEIRLTVVRGQVKSVLLRQTPRVTGDGRRTVTELIEYENFLRRSLDFPYITYPELTSENITFDVHYDFVPAADEAVALSSSTMIAGGASVYDVASQTHRSFIDMAEHLAGMLHAPFVVVDLLCKDYTRQASAGSYVFLEFNTAPALKLYYSVRDAVQQYDIVSEVTDMIETYIGAVEGSNSNKAL